MLKQTGERKQRRMKIYILPINKQFQPQSQPLQYPPHNEDFGVEQDFHKYILKHKELLTQNPDEADWHYLPIYWNRWHISHDFALTGLAELQQEASRCILDDTKTFTICQYAAGPSVNIGEIVVFLSSRNTEKGIDIPLLCSPHKIPSIKPSKRYLASFNGIIVRHPLRREMAEQLKGQDDISIGGTIETKLFVKKIMESYIALCPRGYGGGSYRFFEAMQLGVVPFLISDIDTRPFKRFIDWDEIAFFSSALSEVQDKLASLRKSDKSYLLSMGKRAFICWRDHLNYQKWCPYVIKELEEIIQ